MIKREFILERLPINIDNFKKDIITEGTLLSNQIIRSINNESFYLIDEKKKQITINEYAKLLGSYEPKMITKKRYYIPLTAKLVVQIDVINDNFDTVVVNFDTTEEANNFIIPNWFSAEVINLEDYNQKKLRKAK